MVQFQQTRRNSILNTPIFNKARPGLVGLVRPGPTPWAGPSAVRMELVRLCCRAAFLFQADGILLKGSSMVQMRGSESNWLKILRGLAHIKAPLCLMQLVFSFMASDGGAKGHHSLDSLELFAGKRAYTRAVLKDGRAGVSLDATYEAEDHETMNFLSDKGFVLAAWLVCHLSLGGQLVAAPVCSTWVWICQGTAKRTRAIPLGDRGLECVRSGNEMVSKLMLLIYIAITRGLFFCIEQPKGSLMERHPRFLAMIKQFGWWRKYVEMQNYGGPTPKGSWLYSGHACIEDISKYQKPYTGSAPDELVRRYIDKTGKTKVTANKSLKLSQHYPDPFGEALCKVYRANEALLFLR